jgi:hypothetical protein
MSVRHACLGALFAATLCWSGGVRADAVPPPPRDCPPGTLGQTDHYGPHCAPADCQTDADCQGKSCRAYALCVFDRVFESPRGDTHRREAKGACNAGQRCPLDSPCRPGNYCLAGNVAAPPPATAPPPASPAPGSTSTTPPSPPKKGNCSVGSPAANGAAGVLALALAGVTLGAQRARRRRGS